MILKRSHQVGDRVDFFDATSKAVVASSCVGSLEIKCQTTVHTCLQLFTTVFTTVHNCSQLFTPINNYYYCFSTGIKNVHNCGQLLTASLQLQIKMFTLFSTVYTCYKYQTCEQINIYLVVSLLSCKVMFQFIFLKIND